MNYRFRNIQLKDLMDAVLKRYGGSLYNSTLTKFIYLIDVETVRKLNTQVTCIKWTKNHFGPFVWDIIDCAKLNPDIFKIDEISPNKRLITLLKDTETVLPNEIKTIIDDIQKRVPNPTLSFVAFKDYVYKTPPMVLSRGHGPLDLERSIKAAIEVDALSDTLSNDPEWEESFKYLAAN